MTGLAAGSDLIRAADLLRTRRIGRPLLVRETVGSTNDEVRGLAEAGREHGLVLVADRQTVGRGSHGRPWHSPSGKNLYFSVLLRPRITPATAPLLTLTCGLAVARAIDRVASTHAAIKWPNDVWLGRRKCAGILVEAAWGDGVLRHAVCGIGVNVATRELPPDLAASATSIALATGRDVGRAELLAELLASLEEWIDALEAGSIAEIVRALRDATALLGEAVRFDGTEATLDGIEDDGALRLRLPGGELVRRVAGRLEPA